MDVLVRPTTLTEQHRRGTFLDGIPPSNLQLGGMAPVLELAQHSLPWQETPGSSATCLADNAKERGYFGNGCLGYAIPQCPLPHRSPWVFQAPKEAFPTFKHFVFMKIPSFPPYVQSLCDVESHFTDGETEEPNK